MVFNYQNKKYILSNFIQTQDIRLILFFSCLKQLTEKNEGLVKENKILKEQLECLERTGSDAAVSEDKYNG